MNEKPANPGAILIAHAAMAILEAVDEFFVLPGETRRQQLKFTADRYRQRITDTFRVDAAGLPAREADPLPEPVQPRFPTDESVVVLGFSVGTSNAQVLIPTDLLRESNDPHTFIVAQVDRVVTQIVKALDMPRPPPYDPDCEKCRGTGDAETGGFHPWGAPITVPCDCNAHPPSRECGCADCRPSFED